MKDMKKYLIIGLVFIILSYGCKNKVTENGNNPFFSEWKTPFEVPPFDKIKNEHYLPAINEGIIRHNKEIEKILNNKEEPNFENTIFPLDQSGAFLDRVTNVFLNLNDAYTNDEMQKLAEEITPLLTKHKDDLMLNKELFFRVKTVYDKCYNLKLDSSQIWAVYKYYEAFVRNGANLDTAAKSKLRNINERISALTLKFGQNLLSETNESYKLVIENKNDLAGLPDPIISGAYEAAKADSLNGKWLFTLQKPSWIPFLQYSQNRKLREQIYQAYFMRGNNNNSYDNKEIIKQIVELRAQKAQILGFNNFAEYIIDVNMAKTTKNVNDFLQKLWTPALKISKQEVAEMQKIIDNEKGGYKLESWDWWYYAEKLRKAKYNLDESELKPYLKLDNVRDGMFWVANKLYGITFERKLDLPVYQPEVETYEVRDTNGSNLGILYLDYFPNEGKGAGAWCTTFRSPGFKDGKRILPIVSIVCNFTKPTGDLPSLLTWDETTTLFHEFGHSLQTLFTDGKYKITAGVVPNDYVELPSQVMENWAGEPEVLRQFARHYKTNAAIPEELITKITNSRFFNQGFETLEYLAASILDLDYHMIVPADSIQDILAFEKNAMDKIGLIPEILPRYRSTYFAHIFDGGYEAGYYVYMWAALLDADAFNAFKQTGDIFNKDLAAKFRKYCLAECGEAETMSQYRKFRGQEPSIEPLLEKRGFK